KSSIEAGEAVRKADPANGVVKTTLQRGYLARASALSRLGRFGDAGRDLDEAIKLDDGKGRELYRFARAVAAAREQGREPGMADLANYRQAADGAKTLAADAAIQAKAQRINPASGSELYDQAVLYALFLKGCQQDPAFAPDKRQELAEEYGTRA